MTDLRDEPDKIVKLFQYLAKLLEQEAELINRLDNAPLGQLIDAAGELNEFYKALNEAKQSFGALVQRYTNGLIPKAVLNLSIEQDMSLDSVKTQRAENFRATVGQRYSVSMPDQDDGIDWLKNNGFQDIVKETANSQTLGKLAQEFEERGEELPDDVFKVSKSFSTTLTRHKPKL